MNSNHLPFTGNGQYIERDRYAFGRVSFVYSHNGSSKRYGKHVTPKIFECCYSPELRGVKHGIVILHL